MNNPNSQKFRGSSNWPNLTQSSDNELKDNSKKIQTTPAKWREYFNNSEKQLMKKIMGETLLKLGYETE